MPPGDLSSTAAGSNGLGGSGLPTAAVIALPVGALAVLFLAGWVIYYVKSAEGRKKAKNRSPLPSGRKDAGAGGSGVKDLNGSTTPCLPRHPDQLSVQPPPSEILRQQHLTAVPYSVGFRSMRIQRIGVLIFSFSI